MNNQNNTSTGEPVNQAPGTSENPTPTASGATTPAPAPTAPENTDKAETQVTTSPDLRSAAVDARRQRVEELKKSLTSGSVATAPATTSEAPAPTTTKATETAKAPETAKATETAKAPETATGALAPDYLSGGYYKGEGKGRYIDPDLIDNRAQTLAHDLAAGGLKQSTLNPILRDLKKANKKTLPLDAKHGALSGAIVQAKQLQQRNRTPRLLVEVLERNRATVQTDADYTAAVKHLFALSVYLGDYQE